MNIAGRMYSYDFLKIVATFGIMCHHYQQSFAVHFPYFIDFYGGRIYFGFLVELFFLLSGWGIACKLDITPIGDSIKAHAKFLLGRYRRLIPIVLVASLCEFFLYRFYYDLYGEYLGWKTIYSWYDIALNVAGLAVGSFYNFFYLCIDSPLWYVNVLIMCYWILAVELYLCRRFGWNKMWLFLLTFLAGAVFLTLVKQNSPPYMPFFNASIARGYMGFFGGMMLYNYMKKHTFNPRYFRYMPIVFLLGVRFIGSGTGLFGRVSYLFLDCIFWPTVIIYFSRQELNTYFNKKYVSLLVKATFAMYAMHAPFMDAIKFAERYWGFYFEKGSLVTMGLYLVCMVFVGLTTWYVVERRLFWIR
ncbi:acyltransferase [Anaerovibrio sp. RM50]|uniref:acyltransferase family protein n=1 Tax=Anaerovibrio sp. RM50 TaxID=1200557 RepID=UPI00048047DA|nr:acyltransferase [Anaerovibrio sp. RM50]